MNLFIFHLFSLSYCVFWKYNAIEFENLVRQSVERPIFVVAFSVNCPNCQGLKKEVKQYAINGTGKREDIIITTVNCSSPHRYCKRFLNIKTLPSMFLVIGNDENYWPKMTNKNTSAWGPFFDEYLSNNFKEINSLSQATCDEKYTPFVLETSSNETKEFQLIQRISRYYKIYGNTFFYIIDNTLSSYRLTVLKSPNCSKSYDQNTQTALEFIEQNKFGPLHLFTYQEFTQIKDRHISLMLVDSEILFQSQKEALLSFNDNFCNKITFGYSNDKNLTQKLGIASTDRPSLVYKLPHCIAKTKSRILDAIQAGFFEAAQEKKACDGEFFVGVPPENTIPGLHIVVVYCVIILSLILIIRTDNSPENENKFE